MGLIVMEQSQLPEQTVDMHGKDIGGTIHLPLSISGEWLDADTLRTHLLDAAKAQVTLVLDFSDLRYVEASSLQVLLAAESAGWMADGKVKLIHLSEEVKRCFAYAGVESLLCAEAKVD